MTKQELLDGLQAEHNELSTKLIKLAKFNNTKADTTVDNVIHRKLLLKQEVAMHMYLQVLTHRIMVIQTEA